MRARGLAVVAAVGALAAACSSNASLHASAPVRARVEYRVTGTAPSVTLSYGNRSYRRNVTVPLPWNHVGSAFVGTTVILDAAQPRSDRGHRLECTLAITIPGNPSMVSRDSSHIVGIKAEGGSQKILYDGQCNTSSVVSTTGVP